MTQMTVSLPPIRSIPLATSTYALCLYSDGHRLMEMPEADYALPFLSGAAPTPLGTYRIEARGEGFALLLDGSELATCLADTLAAEDAALAHYREAALSATFGWTSSAALAPAVRAAEPALA